MARKSCRKLGGRAAGRFGTPVATAGWLRHSTAMQAFRRESRVGKFLALRAAILSFLLLAAFLFAWHQATRGVGAVATMSPEYARLMGATATQGTSAMPGPLDVGAKLIEHLRHPFYDKGPNDKGLVIQLAYSIARVMTGYLLPVAVAIPIAFLIGLSPMLSRALDPFIQVLKPVSPLPCMPLPLSTITDSSLSSIFSLFISS